MPLRSQPSTHSPCNCMTRGDPSSLSSRWRSRHPPCRWCQSHKVAYAEPEAPAHYDFSYSVHDTQSGDIKQQSEQRAGDSLQGSYSLVQPDGVHRIVDYTADEVHGFNAVVRYEGHPIEAAAKVAYAHAPVAYASAPVSYAAPVAKLAYAAPVAKVAYAAPVAKLSYAAPVAKVAYSAPLSQVTFSSPAISYHH
ncbi:unnamed protein product, partial [Iphiclides podalirius]